MAKNTISSGALACHIGPGDMDNPGVTKTVTVRRTVTRVCEVITDLSFSVPMQLPAPGFSQASGGVLDLRTFAGDITFFVNKWAFMEAGQKAWLECTGMLKDGSFYTFHVLTGRAITASDVKNGLSRTLPRLQLEKFPNHAALTIVFKIALEAFSEDGAAIVFPALKLTLRKPYRDLTDFNDKTLGRWTHGAGASDARDLTVESLDVGPDGKPGYCVRNFTYSESSGGPILQRTFDDLDNGETYRFSVKVRRYSVQYKTPKLSLRKDSVNKTEVLELVGLDWKTLNFTFVAGSDPVLLDLYSHEASGVGNDWYMDDFLVESVQAAP